MHKLLVYYFVYIEDCQLPRIKNHENKSQRKKLVQFTGKRYSSFFANTSLVD